MEVELEACLEVPTSGIRNYEATVPLPGSYYEEEGIYFLLALSSLRKLMVEVLDAVGYKSTSSFVTYNPAVALELRTQLDDWYRHLPGPLRFQLDSDMLLDTRRAYLRCSYYALVAVASWPFVLPLSQAPAHTPQSAHYSHHPPSLALPSYPSHESVPQPYQQQAGGYGTPTSSSAYPSGDLDLHDLATHRAAAQSCLDACRSYLMHAEEILMQKSLVSHLVVHQYFAFTMILLLNFGGVDLQAEGASMEERRQLERALRNLRYWGVVPFMGGSLSVLMRIARARGLTDLRTQNN